MTDSDPARRAQADQQMKAMREIGDVLSNGIIENAARISQERAQGKRSYPKPPKDMGRLNRALGYVIETMDSAELTALLMTALGLTVVSTSMTIAREWEPRGEAR